jgi:thiamine-monophosphate kinase
MLRSYRWRYNIFSKGLIISIAAVGEANKEDLIYRNGAKDTDLLVVSGDYRFSLYGFERC